MELPLLLVLCALSFLAGFVDSIAGGGGLILVPSLLLSGLPPQVALGTNKFGSIFGTAVALLNFIRSGTVIWRIAMVGLIFSLVGSFFGTKAILFLDQELAARVIIMLLPLTAVVTFLPKKQLKKSGHELTRRDISLVTPLICLLIGFYDGFFGPGTGTFLIFCFYAFLGLNLLNASAVAKVFNLASNIASCVTFALAGKVMFSLAIPLALANLAGGYWGSMLAIRKGQGVVRFFLIIVFMLLFASLIKRYWFD